MPVPSSLSSIDFTQRMFWNVDLTIAVPECALDAAVTKPDRATTPPASPRPPLHLPPRNPSNGPTILEIDIVFSSIIDSILSDRAADVNPGVVPCRHGASRRCGSAGTPSLV
uniref:Uncharacterized protein n=1 Tax=Oryza glumipatula TaxID=40148 RepID=A0A0E0B9X3_9ORYZ